MVFPPLVVGNRVSICISTQPRSPVAQQIDKCPFFFEVSEPARKLFSGMHHASCSKEPGPDISLARLAHNTHVAIAVVYLHAIKLTEKGCALRSPIGSVFCNFPTLKFLPTTTTTETTMTSTRRSIYDG